MTPRLLAPAVALLAACAGAPSPAPLPPIPVEAVGRDLGLLAGDWAGQFVDSRSGRRGTIAFVLEPGRDTARGWVVAEGAPPAVGCTDPVSDAVRPSEDGPTVLRLGGVVFSEGSIAGWLQPYLDFERGCPVDTWFEGRLLRDTLSGMFFAHPATGDTVRRGTWWAARKR